MKLTKRISDGMRSVLGNLGDPSRDKAAAIYFTDDHIPDEQLRKAFEGNWIAKKIVTIPAMDATRKWRRWSGEGGDVIRVAETEFDLREKVYQAMWQARLWGGAAIYIGIEGQDSSEKLDVESVSRGGLRYLNVMTRKELAAGELERDPDSPFYGKPSYYTINGSVSQATIHPSRLAIFHGAPKATTFENEGHSQTHGWGNSELQATYDAMKQAGGIFAGVASLVQEANVDVIGIPDLAMSLSTEDGKAEILNRVQVVAATKGITGSIIKDALESYERHSASFNNLGQIEQIAAMLCSAAADIPATRFLAQSPTGLNSSGDSDMANYHDMLESIQTLKIQPAIATIDQCMIRSATGSHNDVIEFAWNPLKQTSEADQAEIEHKRIDAISKIDLSIVPEEAVYELMKGWGWFSGVEVSNYDDYKTTIEAQRLRLEQV